MRTHRMTLGIGLLILGTVVTASPSPKETCGLKAQVEASALPGGKQTVEYCRQGGLDITQGDIILPPAKAGEGVADGGVISRSSGMWPNATVPVVVDSSLPDQNRVWNAIAQWQKYTSVRFVHRTNQSDYIVFQPGNGCSSSVGRVGGAQAIYLAASCPMPTVIHEIGHALGLWHEQSRNDRDSHVDILWDNILPNHQFNFTRFEGQGMNHGSYDYHSIMHYPSWAFSKNGQPTIVIRGTSTPVPANQQSLSQGDVDAINHLYN